jgi:hypothetical protein
MPRTLVDPLIYFLLLHQSAKVFFSLKKETLKSNGNLHISILVLKKKFNQDFNLINFSNVIKIPIFRFLTKFSNYLHHLFFINDIFTYLSYQSRMLPFFPPSTLFIYNEKKRKRKSPSFL